MRPSLPTDYPVTEFFQWLGFRDGAHFAVFLALSYMILSLGAWFYRGARAYLTDTTDDGDTP